MAASERAKEKNSARLDRFLLPPNRNFLFHALASVPFGSYFGSVRLCNYCWAGGGAEGARGTRETTANIHESTFNVRRNQKTDKGLK